MIAPVLTPRGHLHLTASPDAPPLDPDLATGLQEAFTRGAGHGLLRLGADEIAATLAPDLRYWRDFAARYVSAVCTHSRLEEERAPAHVPAPPPEELTALASSVPPMAGAEYVTADVLGALWAELDAAFHVELHESGESLQAFLKRRSPAWNLVGRVYFNLAENRIDEEAPFAFIATYTTQLMSRTRAQHVPLRQALNEYAGARNRDRLLSLLLAGAARGGEMRVAEEHGGERRHLPPAAMDARRGVPVSVGRAAARKRRGHRPHAGSMESAPAAASSGECSRRRQAAVDARHGSAARLSCRSRSRRRAAHVEGGPATPPERRTGSR